MAQPDRAGRRHSHCLAILIGLGVWQVERRAWKQDLIARIISQSKAEPVAPPAASAWDPATDEFRHVRVTGRFLNDKETLVHGLAAGETPGRALQGYYVLTPLEREAAAPCSSIAASFRPN